MKSSTKLLKFILPLLFFGLLAGCLPYPHTTERSPELRGRVLDTQTHAPIQGAKVFLTQPPQVSTYTDTNGYFHLKATRNFHWARIAPEGDWPDNKDNYIEISHTNYITYGFFDIFGGDAGNILLKPKP